MAIESSVNFSYIFPTKIHNFLRGVPGVPELIEVYFVDKKVITDPRAIHAELTPTATHAEGKGASLKLLRINCCRYRRL